MFYRFKNGNFIEAENFKEAKSKLIDRIMLEEEAQNNWHDCTCTGFNHRFGCPQTSKEIPF